MPITTVNRVKTITSALTAASTNQIVTVYQNSDLIIGHELITGYKIISFNTFIKNLKVYAKIASLSESTLPNFELGDSDTQKAYKVLDVEWKSPRKQLNWFISSDSTFWYPVASISLLNPAGYPYRIYNIQDLFTNNLAIELGENSRVGVQCQEVGYGLLLPQDTVTIHGSYVEEIIVEYAEKPIIINVAGSQNSGTENTNSNNNTLEDDMTDWLIKTASYNANNKDKIVVNQSNDNQIIDITLPSSPVPGNSIKLIKSYPNGTIAINLNSELYEGNSVQSLTIQEAGKEITFIYVDKNTIGWIATNKEFIITPVANSGAL